MSKVCEALSFHKELFLVELHEWKVPYLEALLSSGGNDETINDDEPISSYLLTFAIKKENTDCINDYRKQLDIKYCFICNRFEGEEWNKHLSSSYKCQPKIQSDSLEKESESKKIDNL